MKIKRRIELSRLIGKVDNDFNISESDWIPRVAAWVIDALSQLKVLPMEKKRRTLEVSDRIAQFPCTITSYELKVYDKNGNEIINGDNDVCCTSRQIKDSFGDDNVTIGMTNTSAENGASSTTLININSSNGEHRFYLQGNNIELNFETDAIVVDSYEVATYHDEYYDCDVPYIYDNGDLLEALSWYILFKYLSRGSSHPVYSLKSPSPYTNPFAQWSLLKSKARISVLNDMHNDTDDRGWNNFFYNSTFLPRD